MIAHHIPWRRKLCIVLSTLDERYNDFFNNDGTRKYSYAILLMIYFNETALTTTIITILFCFFDGNGYIERTPLLEYELKIFPVKKR